MYDTFQAILVMIMWLNTVFVLNVRHFFYMRGTLSFVKNRM